MHWKDTAIVIIFITIVASNLYWWQESVRYARTIAAFEQERMNGEEVRSILEQKLAELGQQVPVVVEKPVYIEKVVEKIVEKEVMPVVKSQRMPVLAYSRVTKKGVVGYVEISFVQGKGDTLIDIRPFNSPSVQLSARNAVDAAMREAGIRTLRDKDIKIEFNIDAQAVGGESAGLAIGLAVLALLTDTKIKDTIAATGTIDTDGTVGKVGGILAKAEAVAKKGARLLLIPRGEGEVTALTPHYFVDPQTGEVVRKGEPVMRKINVPQEARRRWNLEVQQVATLAEAKKYAFGQMKD